MARRDRDVQYEFEDVSSFSSNSAYRKTKKAKRKRHRGLKVFICFLCVLLIVFGAGLLFLSNYLIGGLSTREITKDRDALGILPDTHTDPSITNIALFGVDSRGDDFSGRSDVIMILTIDQVHGKIKMASILRDVRVYMGEDYGLTNTGYDKLNHAYAFGGPEYAIRVINQNFRLDVQDYVTVNFNRLSSIIDSVGGIDIEITEGEMEQINRNLGDLSLHDDSVTVLDSDYLYDYGSVHLNGNQAVAYSRIRYIGNDNARAERQQTVLAAMMKKVKGMNKLEYPSMINKMASLCETSLDVGTILGFVPFALSDFTIENLVIPSDVEGYDSDLMENGGWMWLYDTDVAAQHLEDYIYEGDADRGGEEE